MPAITTDHEIILPRDVAEMFGAAAPGRTIADRVLWLALARADDTGEAVFDPGELAERLGVAHDRAVEGIRRLEEWGLLNSSSANVVRVAL